MEPIYTAIVLDSPQKLLGKVPPHFERIFSHHVTLNYGRIKT